MRQVDDFVEISPGLGPYSQAAVTQQVFVRAWQLEAATAVLCTTEKGGWLVIEGDATPLEYAQLVAQCAEQNLPVASMDISFGLAEKLAVDSSKDWFWMIRRQPFPPLSLPGTAEIITDSRRDVEFDSNSTIVATAAGTEWTSGARVVNSVAVATDARRQGLGGNITRLAVQQHFGNGADVVCLGVRGTNRGAIEMYRTLGFEAHHFVHVPLT